MDTSIVNPNYIYALIDPQTNQIRYVGKTNNLKLRFRGHINEAKRGKRDHKNRWVASLLKKDFVPVVRVLEECGDDWKEKETYWIAKLRSDGCNLTNSKLGGDGIDPCEESRRKMSDAKKGKTPWNKGKKTSNESKRKQSEAARRRFDSMTQEERKTYASSMKKNRPNLKGKHKLTPEHKEKLRLANLGNKYTLGRKPSAEAIEKTASAHRGKSRTEETKKKIGDSNRGRKATEATRLKLSDSHKGKAISKDVRQKMSESQKKRWYERKNNDK